MIDNLAKLLKIKSIISIILILVFSFLAVRGVITGEQVKDITLMVVAFYFGTQHEKGGKQDV